MRIAHPKDLQATVRELEEQEVRSVDPGRKWNGSAYVPNVGADDAAECDPPAVVRMKLGLPPE